jgi:energy-coupling factor transport system ATP-binding protein
MVSGLKDISIRGFSCRYTDAKAPALEDITLDVEAGEFVVLAGKSGCGKSTLLRCLNGIIPHLLPGRTDGDILLKGRDISKMSPETISEYAGSVFQNPRSQFFHLNVTDEVAFGPENMDLSESSIRKRVDRAMELFGIDHLRDKQMYTLSSGEQQKVSFAAIYAKSSDIFFLDEPSANLDVEAIEKLKKTLETLKRSGKTILIAEHRLYYLTGLFDRMVVMEEGRIKRVLSRGESLDAGEWAESGLRVLDMAALPSMASSATCEAPKPESEINLTAEKISFSYPRTKKNAVGDISLTFRAGQRIALVGPNGSGKTTLIKLVSGLFGPKRGVFLDRSGRRMPSGRRLENCRLVLQENSHQLFYTTVLDEITSAKHKKNGSSPMALLQELGLDGCADSHPQNLSAGQQQRLVFATAVIDSPPVLILDEPTSGLDAAGMRAIGGRINAEARKGRTVLVVSHDIEFIFMYCDTAIMLRHGKIDRVVSRAHFKSGLLTH